MSSEILTYGAERQLNLDMDDGELDISLESPAKKPKTRVSGPGETHSKEHQLLHDLYHIFEDTLVVHYTPEDKSLKTLVTFDDCKTSAVHRWYTFKEGYSWQLGSG